MVLGNSVGHEGDSNFVGADDPTGHPEGRRRTLRSGRPQYNFGRTYFWALAALFVISSVLAVTRWSEDYHLFVLGAVALLAAFVGREARRRRCSMRFDPHVVGMGLSYIAMLTAFFVDNGKNLPLWRDSPYLSYWLAPSAVGIPLIVWALTRESRIAVGAEEATH
jgi:hypothetical protein